MANLAISTWALGDSERATSLVVRTHARIGEVTHVNTRAWGGMILCMFDLMRHDRLHAVQNAFELARLQREHELVMFRGFAVFLESWARATGDASGAGLENMRRGVEVLREQNVLLFDGLLKIALAEAEERGRSRSRCRHPRRSTGDGRTSAIARPSGTASGASATP